MRDPSLRRPQVCHIPAIAREVATKVEWYWSKAGDLDRVPVVDPETNRADYNKMKGEFVWKKNVRPELRYFDGKWKKALIGVNDIFPAVSQLVSDLTSVGRSGMPISRSTASRKVSRAVRWSRVSRSMCGVARQSGCWDLTAPARPRCFT